jgi:hypothetical protein
VENVHAHRAYGAGCPRHHDRYLDGSPKQSKQAGIMGHPVTYSANKALDIFRRNPETSKRKDCRKRVFSEPAEIGPDLSEIHWFNIPK